MLGSKVYFILSCAVFALSERKDRTRKKIDSFADEEGGLNGRSLVWSSWGVLI
jgi:hypothetical protein